MKKLVYALVLLVLAAVVLELASWALFLVFAGGYSHDEVDGRRAALAGRSTPEDAAGWLAVVTRETTLPGREVIHPFLGYSLDADQDLSTDPFYSDAHVTPLGFFAPNRPTSDEPRFEVAVFGGSLANIFAMAGRDLLAGALERELGLAEGSVAVRSFALGAYKQPQQLMALNYLLMLGERPDLVINLDGFNEVALPVTRNLPSGVFPFYPLRWPQRVAASPDVAWLRELAALVEARDHRERLARVFARPVLRRSVTWNLVWTALDRRAATAVARHVRVVEGLDAKERSYRTHGPPFEAADEPAVYERLAEVWMLASLQMHAACAVYDIPYHHFLQPNQYVPGSKPLSAEERAERYRLDQPARPAVERGYPRLLERGAELRRRGVAFHDLSGIFRDVGTTVYSDDCCHLNLRGYEIVADAVARAAAAAGRNAAQGIPQ